MSETLLFVNVHCSLKTMRSQPDKNRYVRCPKQAHRCGIRSLECAGDKLSRGCHSAHDCHIPLASSTSRSMKVGRRSSACEKTGYARLTLDAENSLTGCINSEGFHSMPKLARTGTAKAVDRLRKYQGSAS